MNNNRRDFIKLAGLAGTASLIPIAKLSAAGNPPSTVGSCVLIPSETAGPFPLDLTTNNPIFFRQDVRETQTGVQLNLKLKIIGVDNCEPMQNLRVNIWHCSKDGLYSGYDENNNPGQKGVTFLRGYQMTNVNGEVEFITIFPGWYSGRVCHIHFQVFVSSSYAAVSQLTFDVAAKNALYAANPTFYPKGADATLPANDNVFSDGYAYQTATLTPNTQTGGYDAYLEVSIKGSGTLGVGHQEKETAKQFILEQNFPNPYSGETTIPFSLTQPSDVSIELWDLSGKKVATIPNKRMNTGEQSVKVNLKTLGLALGSYIYQLEVINSSGTFRQCKMMTSAQ
jgi:protocatechuate 3,4-dioxygenase beta subunit